MVPHFQIVKDGIRRYIIKRRAWLLPPITEMRTMTKNEFFGDLNEYGNHVLSNEVAVFKSKNDAYDAISLYAQIHGITEIIIREREYF